MNNSLLYLRHAELLRDKVPSFHTYPFHLPAVRSLERQSSHSNLYKFLRIARGVRRPKDGFFLRAESYYNVASYIDELDKIAARTPLIKDSYGGKSLHKQSHGESFFATFVHRFGGRGLYLLDEPEAALSPLRQMALLARMHELVQQASQFIIATHSPILMSYPGAEILLLEGEGIRSVSLEETEHYTVTKAFMNNREGMLRELLGDS